MTKSELRKEMLARRKLLADKQAQKTQSDVAILAKVLALPQFREAKTVLTYVSHGSEVDTFALIRQCFELGKTVAVPVIVDEVMRFFEICDFVDIGDEVADFAEAVCITPAVAFSREGFRLGYGGGYYDRFLGTYDIFSIGLCYEEMLADVPVEVHDKKVDVVITD